MNKISYFRKRNFFLLLALLYSLTGSYGKSWNNLPGFYSPILADIEIGKHSSTTQTNHYMPDFSYQISSDTILTYDTLITHKSIKFNVELFDLDIVDPSSGVQFYKDGIIYLADTRDEKTEMKVSFGSLDTYYSPIEEEGLGKRQFFSNRFAFPFPSEATTFAHDFKTLYFTRKSKFKDPLDNHVKILKSEYIETNKKRKTGWSEELEVLPFNGEDFSCVQPSVSEDGKLMIFSSDTPGGDGGFDLYSVVKEGDGWGKPVNLGNAINTNLDELFPFLLNTRTLIFASDGHKGYGGIDIFMAKFDGEKWEEVINLGRPINSPGDEIAFTMNRADINVSFFSSNRRLFKKRFQLFRAELISGENVFKNVITYDTVDLDIVISEKWIVDTLGENISPAIITTLPSQIVEGTTPSKIIAEAEPEILDIDTVLHQTEQAAEVIPEKVEQPDTIEVMIEPEVSPVTLQEEPQEIHDVKGKIDFRVQFKASMNKLNIPIVTIEGKDYKTFEYFYVGAYRYTIGSFATPEEAIELKNICQKMGYKDAFVAAFENDKRVVDPKVFEKYKK